MCNKTDEVENGASVAVDKKDNVQRRKVPNINIEPVIFLYSVHSGVLSAVVSAFVYYKVCVLRFAETVSDVAVFCESLGQNGSTAADQALVEQDSSYLNEYLTIVATLPACLTAFVIGWWSDRYGRKLSLLLSLFGTFVNIAAHTYSATIVQSSSLVLILAGLVHGCTGNFVVMFQLTFSMLRDCFPDSRQFSIRISIITGLLGAGSIIGGLIGAYMVDRLGYSYVMLVALAFMSLSLVYAACFMRETAATYGSVDPEGSNGSVGLGGKTESKWDAVGVVKTFETLIRIREQNKHRHLWLGLFAFFLTSAADIGIWQILLLFLKLPPILISDSAYSYFSVFQSALACVGVPLSVWLLKKFLNCRDTVVAMVGVLTQVLKYTVIATSRTLIQFFIAGAFSVTGGLIYTGFRAYLVTLVHPEETGRLFALVAVVETVGPLVASVIFNNLYPLTIAFFPGLTFLAGSGIFLVAFFPILYTHFCSHQLFGCEEVDKKPILEDANA